MICQPWAGSLLPRLAPAEAGLARDGIHRAGGHAVRDRRIVVAGGRHVVGRVGMEQGGEVLDLPPTWTYLALPAAVDRDPLAIAVVVHRQHLAQRAEPRRLRVDRLRLALQAFDVGE